jgi:hypothetical protein
MQKGALSATDRLISLLWVVYKNPSLVLCYLWYPDAVRAA